MHSPAQHCCPLVRRKALLKPHQLSAVFFGKRCSETGREGGFCGFEDLHGPYLYLMGEIFPGGRGGNTRSTGISPGRQVGYQDLTMQLILDLFGILLLNRDSREPAKAFPFSQGASKPVSTSSLHFFPCYRLSFFFFFFFTVKEILISCLAWFSSRSLLPPASRCGVFFCVLGAAERLPAFPSPWG